MIESRTVGAAVEGWQAELDAGLETGETPVFPLGFGAGMLGELAGPLALQALDETRRDTRMPLAVGGGPAPFWLPALLHQRAADTPPLSPATVFCFTAPDRATHTAAINTLDTRRLRFRRRPGGLPPGFGPLFVAGAGIGPFPGETLPLLLSSGLLAATAAEQRAVAPLPAPGQGAPASAAGGGQDEPHSTRDGWVAWAAVVMAVALFLIALVA